MPTSGINYAHALAKYTVLAVFLNNFQIKRRELKQKIMEGVWKPSFLVPSDNEGLSLTLTESQLFDKEVLLDA